MTPQEISNDLAQFCGSETLTRWSILFRNCLLTEGAKFVADECGAYWLMDAIASWQTHRKLEAEYFQIWTLKKCAKDGQGWDLTGENGNNGEIAHQYIAYSDFPLADGIKLFACRNELGGVTIMLPGEY